MAVQLTSEQQILAETTLGSPYIATSSGIDTLVGPTHEYELNQSESLNFLYNLLYDDESNLTKADVLSILTSFQDRESELPFAFSNNDGDPEFDLQGISWPPGLKQAFANDRERVGQSSTSPDKGWFFNIPNLREKVKSTLDEYFQFQRYFGKLRLHITHFQLRNLVCCGSDISKGIYYPLSYYQEAFTYSNESTEEESYEYGSNFFRINRLSPDGKSFLKREPMKLDCMLDSENLLYNSNSRISTLTCSDELLVCGTFEGGYILMDLNNDDEATMKSIGEYQLTSKEDGITNNILISRNNQELVICSNDKYLRIVDIETSGSGHSRKPRVKTTFKFPFAINCLALNKNNPNEALFCGDDINSYILDTRSSLRDVQILRGHEDYGFCCDWSSSNENLLVTGNQDGTVKLWDRRNVSQSTFTWVSSLGRKSAGSGLYSSQNKGAPVRNTKFSHNGDFIAWAECLDHLGIVPVDSLKQGVCENGVVQGVQSVEFIGKCTGISFAPTGHSYGEDMVIGVNDCPLGGILTMRLNGAQETLDFDL